MNGFFCKTKYGGVCQMMEDEALQVIQKMNVKINGTEDEVKKDVYKRQCGSSYSAGGGRF